MALGKHRLIETNLKPYRSILQQIDQHDFRTMAGNQLRDRLAQLKKIACSEATLRASGRKTPDALLPEAFALVTAAVYQELGWTTHENQLLAALAMRQGRIVELDTGEGKTLVAVYVAVLRALSGQSVHVLTFNDYLAGRDAAWMGPVYNRLGLRAAAVSQEMTATQRRQAYKADVTYLTAKEAGFDYLRGFLALEPKDLVQSPFHNAIVDEADSILIDEARIPLVLAGSEASLITIDPALLRLARAMQADRHFYLDEQAGRVVISDEGAIWLEKSLGLTDLYAAECLPFLFQIRQFLTALHLLRKDVDYIVRNSRIELVDEFTGRVIKNRQWPDGLHEAVEIKEGLSAHTRGSILNRITMQDFCSLYGWLCGMTGTAASAANEFSQFYGLGVTRIEPNMPCRRIDHPDLIYPLRQDKEKAVLQEIRRRNRCGQPILIGTGSVAESERLAEQVRAQGLACSVLNARHDQAEAAIIAQAGCVGAITLSTHMAGRGVDITLEDRNGPGLLVIGTNRHRSIRIDRQLRGRAGRQGDPGESLFFLSLQDDLVERYQIRTVLPPAYRTLSHYEDKKQNEPVAIIDRRVRLAMDHTQRVVEGQLYQQRRNLVRYTILLEEQRRRVYDLRTALLTGRKQLTVWQQCQEPERQEKVRQLIQQTSEQALRQAQQQAAALLLNREWADYLVFVDQLLDHVSLMQDGPNDPLTTFNRQIIDAYTFLLDTLESDLLAMLDILTVTDGHISLATAGLSPPPATRTYLIDDGSDSLAQIMGVSKLVAAAVNPAAFLLSMLGRRFNEPPENDR